MEETREFKAYTYYLYHMPTGKKYYGVRWANKCEPEQDLWHEYFSSSNLVKILIKEYGKDSFITQIRKTFDTVKEAHTYEQRFLRKIDAVKNDNWLNQSYACGPFYSYPIKHSEDRIQKNRESHLKLYSDPNYKNVNVGSKRDDITRERMRTAWKNRTPDSEDTRAKKKRAKAGIHVGQKNPMYGRSLSAESIAKGLATKKRNGTSPTGSKNGMFGRKMKWIFNKETGLVKRLDHDKPLPIGWTYGRK